MPATPRVRLGVSLPPARSCSCGAAAATAVAAPADIDPAGDRHCAPAPADWAATGGPTIGGCPALPADNAVEHAGWPERRCTRRSSSDRLHDPRRRRHRLPARRLRREPCLRHPLRRRAGDPTRVPIHYTEYGDESDPAPSPSRYRPRRGWRGRAPATGTSSPCNRGRASSTSCLAFARRSRWDADSGANFDLVRTSSARGVDVGRCRRPTDPSRPRALRRGSERRDQSRPALHRGEDPARLHPAGDALRVEPTDPTLPPWVCACG